MDYGKYFPIGIIYRELWFEVARIPDVFNLPKHVGVLRLRHEVDPNSWSS